MLACKQRIHGALGFLGVVVSMMMACSPTPATTSSGAASSAAKPAATAQAAKPSGGDDWSKVVTAAKQEGTLVLSVHAGSGYEDYAEAVKKALPDLKVEVTSIKASDFAARAITEQQNGQYLWDVHMGPVSNIFTVLTPANALDPIKPYLEALPADVRDNSKWAGGFEMYTDPKNPVTFLTMLTESGGVYINRELVPEGLKGPDDLLDPKWSGKIAVYNPVVSNGGSMSLAGIMAVKGDDFMKKLMLNQDVKYISTSRQITEFIAQGRYPIAFGAEDLYLQELKDKGVGKSVERDRSFGTYVLASGVSVLKNAPHPNATKVYLNWALSQEGQDAYAKLSSADANSRRVDVPVYHPDSVPDYAHLEKYPAIQGTASAVDVQERFLALAKQH